MDSPKLIDLLLSATPADIAELDEAISTKWEELARLQDTKAFLEKLVGNEPNQGPIPKAAKPKAPPPPLQRAKIKEEIVRERRTCTHPRMDRPFGPKSAAQWPQPRVAYQGRLEDQQPSLVASVATRMV